MQTNTSTQAVTTPASGDEASVRSRPVTIDFARESARGGDGSKVVCAVMLELPFLVRAGVNLQLSSSSRRCSFRGIGHATAACCGRHDPLFGGVFAIDHVDDKSVVHHHDAVTHPQQLF